jgi:hypothetical protein
MRRPRRPFIDQLTSIERQKQLIFFSLPDKDVRVRLVHSLFAPWLTKLRRPQEALARAKSPIAMQQSRDGLPL